MYMYLFLGVEDDGLFSYKMLTWRDRAKKNVVMVKVNAACMMQALIIDMLNPCPS